MIHKIKKTNIFNFLKSESVIEEINLCDINVIENSSELGLKKLTVTNLNKTSKYWLMNPETNTFLQPFSKKVDGIILEYTKNNEFNVILIELKSKNVHASDVKEKFEKSLSWVYLLLNLLNSKENQEVKVFGILVAQKNKNWNEKDTLQILSSTSIRYIKRSFFTTLDECLIDYNELVKDIIKD